MLLDCHQSSKNNSPFLPTSQRQGEAKVVDRLAAEGPLLVSEQLKTEFLRREQAFFSDPNTGETWEAVREELFGK